MKTTLKKSLSLLLAIIITISLAAPAMAADPIAGAIEQFYVYASEEDATSKNIDKAIDPSSVGSYSGTTIYLTGYVNPGDGYHNKKVEISTTNTPAGDPINNDSGSLGNDQYTELNSSRFCVPVKLPFVSSETTYDLKINIQGAEGYSAATRNLSVKVKPNPIETLNMTITGESLNETKANGSSVDIANNQSYNLSGVYYLENDSTKAIPITDSATWTNSNSVLQLTGSGKSVTIQPYGLAGSSTVTLSFTNDTHNPSKDCAVIFNIKAGPTLSIPEADKTVYIYKGTNEATETAENPHQVLQVTNNSDYSYQWFKITYDADNNPSTPTEILDSDNNSINSYKYTPSTSTIGTVDYYCLATKNGISTKSHTFTVKTVYEYEINVTSTEKTVSVNDKITVKAEVKHNVLSVNNSVCTPTLLDDQKLTWALPNSTFASLDVATNQATVNKFSDQVANAQTNIYSVDVYGVKATDAVTLSITRVGGTTTDTLNATVSIKVSELPSFSVSATIPSNGAEFSMIATNELTKSSVKDQIIAGFGSNPSVQYVVFESFTNDYGKLSTASTIARYYLTDSIPTAQRSISEVTYTPNGTPGTDSYVMRAFAEDGTEKIVNLSIKSSKNLTGIIDIAYNVKINTTIALDEQDFIDWFLGLDSQYTALKSVKFTGTASHGSLKYGTSLTSIGTSEYYTKAGAPSTSSNLLSNVKFKAGSTKGSDGIEFTATGTNARKETVTKTGVVYFCVTSKDIGEITYNVKYGTNTSLSESDFTTVYKAATGATSTAPQFSVQITKNPQYGTLYRYGTKSATYKVDAHSPVNLYVNQTGTERSESTYNLGDVIYVPIALSSGEIPVQYAAYNSKGELQYIGTVKFIYNGGEQKFTCGAEGYKFSVSDFVSSSDSDPIVSVSFTPLAASSSGKLYYDYANGKGTLITGIEKFSTTTGGTISSVVYIPRSQTPVNQDITYSATTKSGKSISATITIKYLNRTVSQKFTDVKDSWAIPGVDFCSAWGIANGTGGSTFTPAGTMQRCMLVAMLYRMAGSPNVSASNPFKDVSVNDYYYAAVLWAYSKQIVTGTTATTFSPKAAVTRQDIATMLWRYAGCPTASASYLNKYTDASSVSSYAVQPMSWAVSQGIITGSGNKLTPTASGTRAQVAAMLHRYLA